MSEVHLRSLVRNLLLEFTVDLGNGKILQIPDDRLSELPGLLGIEPMDKDIVSATPEKVGDISRFEMYNMRVTDLESWPDEWNFTYKDIMSRLEGANPNTGPVKKALSNLVSDKTGKSISGAEIIRILGNDFKKLLSNLKSPTKADFKGARMAPDDESASSIQAVPAIKNWLKALESSDEGKAVLEKHSAKLNKLYGGMTYLLSNYGNENVAMILDSIFVQNQTPEKADSMLENLYSIPVSSLFSGFNVPGPLLGLAKTKNESRGGRTGAGEFLLPFIFKDANVQVDPVVLSSEEGGGGTANAEFDIFINNAPYHVKAIETATKTAPLGKQSWGKGRPSKSADFISLAKKYGINDPTAEFTKQAAIIKMAKDEKFAEIVSSMGGESIDSVKSNPLESFQKIVDEDMRSLGMGDAAGVIFYIESDDRFEYVKKDELKSQNASQSAHRIGLENTNGYFARLSESRSRTAIRHVVSAIIKEELTRTDKNDIERIARKQAKKYFDQQISKSIETEIGRSFLGTRGKINKHVDNAITDRFKKANSDKDFDEAVIKVCRRVLKALTDMHYKRTNLIDQMPIPKS